MNEDDNQEMLALLFSMNETKMKVVDEAIAELKKQIAELKKQAENLEFMEIRLQKAVHAVIVEEMAKGISEVSEFAKQTEKRLNRVILALNLKLFVFACGTVFCAVFALIFAAHANVAWETSKLKDLAEQKATMEENIERLGKLKGHLKITTCGKDKLPCVEIEAKNIYYDDDKRGYYVLKGVK